LHLDSSTPASVGLYSGNRTALQRDSHLTPRANNQFREQHHASNTE
jgi:hypothetical protein